MATDPLILLAAFSDGSTIPCADTQTVQLCAEFNNVGFGALINTLGLPPADQPQAQCWFQVFYIFEGVQATMLDNLVMCKRRQLSSTSGEFRLFCITGMCSRVCAHAACSHRQYKLMAPQIVPSRLVGQVLLDGTLGGKPRLQVCDDCWQVHYCNAACQHADWASHRCTCRASDGTRRASRIVQIQKRSQQRRNTLESATTVRLHEYGMANACDYSPVMDILSKSKSCTFRACVAGG